MAMLAHTFFGLVERDGWEYYYFEPSNISILWPFESIVQDASTTGFLNFRHRNSSLGISVAIQDAASAQRTHDYVQGRHELRSQAYSVRKRRLAISTSTQLGGSILYARSDLIDGTWTTFILSAERQDEGILNAMAGSVRHGRAPSLRISRNGKLEQAILQTAEVLKRSRTDDRDEAGAADEPTIDDVTTDRRTVSSGSGFFVSSAGATVTNLHVVENCNSILVDNLPAVLVAQSSEFDLALLEVDNAAPDEIAVFSASSTKLNADVIAVGFPYAGLLGGLNVTRGSVSALKGLKGDATRMQITAPIQSGNSGGPVLGADGEVVGVIVSKLDAMLVEEATGDTPQNVNFAIRGEIARMFLAQNGIEPLLSMDDEKLEPEALAEKAANFTVFIECR